MATTAPTSVPTPEDVQYVHDALARAHEAAEGLSWRLERIDSNDCRATGRWPDLALIGALWTLRGHLECKAEELARFAEELGPAMHAMDELRPLA